MRIISFLVLLSLPFFSMSSVLYAADCDIIYEEADGSRNKVREPGTFARAPKRNNGQISQKDFFFSAPIFSNTTFLRCSAAGQRQGFHQIEYEVLSPRANASEGANIVGKVEVQYDAPQRRLRLRWIEIDERYQQKHHATKALETLFSDLKCRDIRLANPVVHLEVSITKKHLFTLYTRMGFVAKSQAADVLSMEVLLRDIKLPFYEKLKAMKAAAQATSSTKAEAPSPSPKAEASVKEK